MNAHQRCFVSKAWRMAAIYRCVVRYGKSHGWALFKVREVFPDGSRDDVVRNWFIDMDNIRSRGRRDIVDRRIDLLAA